MPKHVWTWDKKSEKPMRVVCVKCGQHERLDTVLRQIGCEGCTVKVVQGKLIDVETGEVRRAED